VERRLSELNALWLTLIAWVILLCGPALALFAQTNELTYQVLWACWTIGALCANVMSCVQTIRRDGDSVIFIAAILFAAVINVLLCLALTWLFLFARIAV
jgi:hypothetical protein